MKFPWAALLGCLLAALLCGTKASAPSMRATLPGRKDRSCAAWPEARSLYLLAHAYRVEEPHHSARLLALATKMLQRSGCDVLAAEITARYDDPGLTSRIR